MITDKDIIKLKEVFATKSELRKLSDKTDQGFAWMIHEFGKIREEMTHGFATKDDLKKFATKDDLKQFATKDDIKRLEKAMVTKSNLAEIMGELKAIREDQAAASYRRIEVSDTISSHETRISTLENKLSFPE